MLLLWWLYRHKNIMPWEVYGQSQGYRDLTEAFVQRELEQMRDQAQQLKVLRSAAPRRARPVRRAHVRRRR